MAHDERRLEVLRAIVQDYVATNEPVGSKALVERHDLGVSPATVRNDMAVLEEEGYITQPHTSAGRVPTDKGYRLFVDRLSAVKPLSVGRAPGDRALPRRRRRPGRRGAPHGPAARPAHPPGRRRAVPDAVPLRRPPPRAGPDLHHPADAGDDHRHRPGRAARRRPARCDVDAEAVAELRTPAQLRVHRRASSPTPATRCPTWSTTAPPHLRGLVATVSATLLETLVERSEDRLVLGGHGQPGPRQRARLPGHAAARSWRRWRNRSSSCG